MRRLAKTHQQVAGQVLRCTAEVQQRARAPAPGDGAGQQRQHARAPGADPCQQVGTAGQWSQRHEQQQRRGAGAQRGGGGGGKGRATADAHVRRAHQAQGVHERRHVGRHGIKALQQVGRGAAGPWAVKGHQGEAQCSGGLVQHGGLQTAAQETWKRGEGGAEQGRLERTKDR